MRGWFSHETHTHPISVLTTCEIGHFHLMNQSSEEYYALVNMFKVFPKDIKHSISKGNLDQYVFPHATDILF